MIQILPHLTLFLLDNPKQTNRAMKMYYYRTNPAVRPTIRSDGFQGTSRTPRLLKFIIGLGYWNAFFVQHQLSFLNSCQCNRKRSKLDVFFCFVFVGKIYINLSQCILLTLVCSYPYPTQPNVTVISSNRNGPRGGQCHGLVGEDVMSNDLFMHLRHGMQIRKRKSFNHVLSEFKVLKH